MTITTDSDVIRFDFPEGMPAATRAKIRQNLTASWEAGLKRGVLAGPPACPTWCMVSADVHRDEASDAGGSFYLHRSANLCAPDGPYRVAGYVVEAQTCQLFSGEPSADDGVWLDNDHEDAQQGLRPEEARNLSMALDEAAELAAGYEVRVLR